MTTDARQSHSVPSSTPSTTAAAPPADLSYHHHLSPHDLARVRKVEALISNLLRGGVIVSLFVIVLGTALSFVHHREYLRRTSDLTLLTRPGAAFPHSASEVLHGVADLRGQSIATLGLLLLIATPVARVAISILAFAYERDRTFVLITTLVLALLLLSFLLGRAGG